MTTMSDASDPGAAAAPRDISATPPHRWRFFRAGGFDQVQISTGRDLQMLHELDQKLWAALSCPTQGLELDAQTLALIDTDGDGRIRPPELLAAIAWACSMLRNPDILINPEKSLPLSEISDATPEGATLRAAAKEILTNLGKSDRISVEDTTHTTQMLTNTRFNGDGVIIADSAEALDEGAEAVRKVIGEIIASVGGEDDRSGKPGVGKARLTEFYAELDAYDQWQSQVEADAESIYPLGEAASTAAAWAALVAVRPKVEDFFARCRLAAYDARAVAALNTQESSYLAVAASDLTLTSAEIAHLPLAQVGDGHALPLHSGCNPAWEAAVAQLRDKAITPLLGELETLTEAQWRELIGRFKAYEAWVGGKKGAAVEALGLARVRELRAGPEKQAILDLIARDEALAPQFAALQTVDKLVRYHRYLYKLIVNFVNLRDFYSRKERAIFQAGRLYLDQRSCDLCVRVDDMAKHTALAHMSNAYLAYCDLTRRSTNEKMTIVAAFTAGDSDYLMVGRNGVFYDRQGRDWDATITKCIENPINLRQAFWAPYKRLIRWVQEQVAKRAAAADAGATTKLTGAVEGTVEAAKSPTPAAPAKPKFDVGTVAVIGVAVGGIATAVGAVMEAFFGLGIWMPIGLCGMLLAISGPSMVISWLKLRQRSIGPILDANGWAINARAWVNAPFGRSLTAVATMPKGAQRNAKDAYAENYYLGRALIAAAIVVVVLWFAWFLGGIERVAPGLLRPPTWVQEGKSMGGMLRELFAPPKLELPKESTPEAAPEAPAG